MHHSLMGLVQRRTVIVDVAVIAVTLEPRWLGYFSSCQSHVHTGLSSLDPNVQASPEHLSGLVCTCANGYVLQALRHFPRWF